MDFSNGKQQTTSESTAQLNCLVKVVLRIAQNRLSSSVRACVCASFAFSRFIGFARIRVRLCACVCECLVAAMNAPLMFGRNGLITILKWTPHGIRLIYIFFTFVCRCTRRYLRQRLCVSATAVWNRYFRENVSMCCLLLFELSLSFSLSLSVSLLHTHTGIVM